MKRLSMAATGAALFVLVLATPVSAATPQTGPAQESLRWLECVQLQASGQVGPGGGNANPIARSAEVALSLAAAGEPASAFRHVGQSLADYLKSVTVAEVGQTSTPVGTGGELLLARVAQPNTGPTADLVGQLTAAYNANSGEYGGDVFSDALAILGLGAAGQPIKPAAVTFLRNTQNTTDHGWSFDNAGQFGSDSNTTSLVIQALLVAGVPTTDTTIVSGFAFLQTQFQNGGFVFQASSGTTPDANSDELAIQAIVGAHRDSEASWASRLATADTNLVSLQVPVGQPDAGALQGFDKLVATTLAAPAFLLRPMTVHTLAGTTIPLLSCPAAASTPPAGAVPQLARTGAGVIPITMLAIAIIFWLAGLVLWRRRRA